MTFFHAIEMLAELFENHESGNSPFVDVKNKELQTMKSLITLTFLA